MAPAPVMPDSSPSTSSLGATLAPIVAFLALNRLGGLRAGIAAATATAVIVAWQRRQRGIAIGRLMPLTTAAIVVRGAVGIATDSEAWYFGLGIAAKFGAALALAISIVVRRPLADYAVAAVVRADDAARSHPTWISTMAKVSGIGVLYFCAAGAIDIWLYRRSSVEGFVVLRFFANWPLGAAAIGAAALVCSRALPNVPGVGALRDPRSNVVDQDHTPKQDFQ